jgi:hypothetical protein
VTQKLWMEPPLQVPSPAPKTGSVPEQPSRINILAPARLLLPSSPAKTAVCEGVVQQPLIPVPIPARTVSLTRSSTKRARPEDDDTPLPTPKRRRTEANCDAVLLQWLDNAAAMCVKFGRKRRTIDDQTDHDCSPTKRRKLDI